MARQAKLGKKNGHYYSEAGGTPKYYGKIGVVSFRDATRAFREHLSTPKPAPTLLPPRLPIQVFTVNDLVTKFLTWLGEYRADRTNEERKRHLRRFGEQYGALEAASVDGSHLEAFQDELRARGHAPDYVRKHVTSVRMMFNKGVKQGWLPAGLQPFARVEPIRVQDEPIQEGELPTDEEVKTLFAHADDDLSPRSLGRGKGWRRREPHEYRTGESNPWRGFEAMLRTFYATGARTSELAAVTVGDLQPRTRQLILGKHKRSTTMRAPTARQIVLNEETFALLERLCHGRAADSFIFTLPRSDKAWNRFTLAKRFVAVRERAGVRPEITVYSFRHLWISEALMAGVDILTVAKLAGTSVQMIEQTYGHLRVGHLLTAQNLLDAARAKR